MIIPPMPVFDDKNAEEEVRKAFVNLALQLNKELESIRAEIAALTP